MTFDVYLRKNALQQEDQLAQSITRDGEQQIQQQILDYLRQTPLALGILVMSFFSGQLWAFILTAFIRSKTRGNKFIESILGRLAMGIIWFTAVSVPIYLIKFGNMDFQYERILQIAIPTLVTGMLAQLMLFALFAYYGDRR